MQKLLLLTSAFFLLIISANAQEDPLKEYVKSFSLKSYDTIVLELHIPYEIIDWDKNVVRTFTKVESFSLPKEILKKVARSGRYRMKSTRKDSLVTIHMPGIHHKITVAGLLLSEEVVAQIYIPEGFPLRVICSSKTPQEQLENLWLQQEVLTRRLKYPIKKAINSDHYYDVKFEEGTIIAANEVKGTKRFLQLKVQVGNHKYDIVSRIGKLYKAHTLLNQKVVFVKHDIKSEIRKMPNQGMVLIKENSHGKLTFVQKEDLPDFFFDI